jgi:hypothetical protein
LAAARAAGDIVLPEAAPLLTAVQNNLPRPAPGGKGRGRTLEEIAKEIQKLMAAEATDASEEKVDKLMEELERAGQHERCIEELKAAPRPPWKIGHTFLRSGGPSRTRDRPGPYPASERYFRRPLWRS